MQGPLIKSGAVYARLFAPLESLPRIDALHSLDKNNDVLTESFETSHYPGHPPYTAAHHVFPPPMPRSGVDPHEIEHVADTRRQRRATAQSIDESTAQNSPIIAVCVLTAEPPARDVDHIHGQNIFSQ